MKRIKRFGLILLTVVVVFWLLQKWKAVPSFNDIFRSKPIVIDETPVLITQIRSIGQLVTYSLMDEVVVDSTIMTRGAAFVNAFNRFAPAPLLPPADKLMVLIGRGKVLAGTDLTLLTDSSLRISNDTVYLTLPHPQILQAVINPSDFETFAERGEWSDLEVSRLKISARNKMIQDALKQHILEKAGKKSQAIMEDFITQLGYKLVINY